MYNRWMPPPDELYHYGVLGMKWGVHKYKEFQRKGISNTREYKQARKRRLARENEWISNEAAAVDKRLTELEKKDKRVSDLKKNFSGDGSEYTWKVESITGDKKLKSLDERAANAYKKIDSDYNKELKPVYQKHEARAESGMKRTVQRAESKLQNYEKRYQKNIERANKKLAKADKRATSVFYTEDQVVAKYRSAARSKKKADKIAKKGAKWYNEMQTHLGSSRISNSSHALGKAFVDRVIEQNKDSYLRKNKYK